MKLKILSIVFAMAITMQMAISAPFNANAKTKRIPAGTQFKLELLNPVTTNTQEGSEFSAILATDQKDEDEDVILPSGSLVRGTIKKITPSKRMSRGAILYLDFDHVVTPNGRQLPLTFAVIGRSDMTVDGGITTTKGYGDAIKQNWNKTVDIAKTATQWGKDKGEGWSKAITVPIGAIGGGIGGGAYFIGDSVADLIRKGKDVNIEKGSKIDVILVDPIDVPVL